MECSKVLFRFSLATVALMGLGTASVFAQAPSQNVPPSQPPKNGPTSVALVDVGAIIKAHPTMNAEMEKIKAEMEAAHDAIENRRKSLLTESETIVKTTTLTLLTSSKSKKSFSTKRANCELIF
jgi:Skp family chaperone for outer membrane proteins